MQNLLTKSYFFKMFKFLFTFFIDITTHVRYNFIYSDYMRRHVCTTCNSLIFKWSTEKNIFSVNSFFFRPFIPKYISPCRPFPVFSVDYCSIILKQQKQINIFIEMIVCLAVGCKSDTRQGKD